MIKSFKQFLFEDIQRAEVEDIFNKFKKNLESSVKKITKQPFSVIITNHFLDRVIERSTANDPSNIPITTQEFKDILDTVARKFLSKDEKGEGGLVKIKSPTNNDTFKITPERTWVFKHKVYIVGNEKHYRCVDYTIDLTLGKDEKGKIVVVNKPHLTLVTIQPSDRDGHDNPKYRDTVDLTESFDSDMINYI